MNALTDEIKSLIRQGIYSLYQAKDGTPVLYIPPEPPYSSRAPSVPRYYKLDKNGAIERQYEEKPEIVALWPELP